MTMRDLGRLTTDLGRRLVTFFDAPLAADATPLEVVQAVLDDVERRVERVGRGRRVFPYAALEVQVLASDDDAPRFVAAFDGIDARIRERLSEIRCEPTATLTVALDLTPTRPEDWADGQILSVQYRGVATAVETTSAATGEPRRALRIVVVKGEATAQEYHFTGASIAIGRTPDPMDDHGRLRRNRVAFVDVVDGVTETVGRAHARLLADQRGGYRLVDDGSRNGTSILRDGEVITVHARDPRGVRVRPGDEIQVGRAVVRVEFD